MIQTREFAVVQRSACPVCESADGRPVFETYDDRYGQPDSFTVVACDGCGSTYLREAIVAEQLGALYDRYYGRGASGSLVGADRIHVQNGVTVTRPSPARRLRRAVLYRTGLAAAVRAWYLAWTAEPRLQWPIYRGERVLEIGPALGGLARLVQARGAEWVGLEISQPYCEALRAQGLPCMQGTIETADVPAGSFDAIIASEVIEHQLDPGSFLEQCARVLRPGGRLLLNTPNAGSRRRRQYGEGWIHWFVPYHQVLFTPDSLVRLGRAHGFVPGTLRTVTPASWTAIQRQYARPPRGTVGAWRMAGRVGRLQPSLSTLRDRLQDRLAGDGDQIVAALIRA